MQTQLDAYHRDHPGPPDPQHYEDFLRSIGYLQPEPDDFKITTSNVDPEITRQFGPQLIVPLLNARFAANAANARWGSLYDAVYGTDVIPDEGELARGAKYNPRRGERVIAFGRRLLDEFFPLTGASHTDVDTYQVAGGALIAGVACSRDGAGRARPARRPPRRAGPAQRAAAAPPRPARRDRRRPGRSDRRLRPGRRARPAARIRDNRDHGPGGLGRRGRRRGQDRSATATGCSSCGASCAPT